MLENLHHTLEKLQKRGDSTAKSKPEEEQQLFAATAGLRESNQQLSFQNNRLENKDFVSVKDSADPQSDRSTLTPEAPVSKTIRAQQASGCFCADFNHIIFSAISARAPDQPPNAAVV